MTQTPLILTHVRPWIGSLFWIFFLISASSVWAQDPPRILLNDSRGAMQGSTLTIGLDLVTRLTEAQPNQTYDLELHDERGTVVSSLQVTADDRGGTPWMEIWDRSGVDGCQDDLALVPPASGEYTFDNFEQASWSLNGRIFSLNVFDPQTRVLLTRTSVELEVTDSALYYWSDAEGNAQCFFETGETVFLSVFQGEQESFVNSRVFFFQPPALADKDTEWDVGWTFSDLRTDPECEPWMESCGFPTGTLEEDVPMTMTSALVGELPSQGIFLAIIRDAANGLTDPTRYLCDRATESVMTIHVFHHDLTDNEDGWGCPPCRD